MILEALNNYYQRLAADPEVDVAAPGYSREQISFALVINGQGALVDVQDLRNTNGKKPRRVTRKVPAHERAQKRTSRIAPYFLWDKTTYVLGAEDESKITTVKDLRKRRDRARRMLGAFRDFQYEVGRNINDEGMQAVLRFLDAWDPERATELELWPDMAGTNVMFRLDGDNGFLHERPAVRSLWEQHVQQLEGDKLGICLVTGQHRSVARLHPFIKHVWRAQPSGATLSSCNTLEQPAFGSYGKEQNHNAPVSTAAAFAYTTALNHLLRRESHQRVQIGDASTVFWTERPSPAEDFLSNVLGDHWNDGDAQRSEDSAQVQRTRALLEAIRLGRHPPELGAPSTRFFILGLAPNESRLIVRFWQMSTVGELATALGRHFADLALERQYANEPEFPGMWRLLLELLPYREGQRRSSYEVAGPLASAFMRALLTGADYPRGLYSGILGRLRADGHINYPRAALLKACLVRSARRHNQPSEVTMSLNESCSDIGYLLGRLFAVLEKAQRDALSSQVSATIKDRFYGSASATPAVVFPYLMRNAQHHISKAEYGGVDDRRLAEIMERIEVARDRPGFPPHLSNAEQGMFALGYYHQRNDLYRKRGGSPASLE